MKRKRRGRSSTRSHASPWSRAASGLLLGLAATLGSSTVEQEAVARYAGIEGCAMGCPVAAAGWPLPYVLDDPTRSSERTASLRGVATGADRMRAESFAADLLAWSVVATVLLALLRRLRR
jgi:hypothetical protein